MERLKSQPWLSLAIAVIIISAWMGRFEIVGNDQGGYRLDRWTGTVRIYAKGGYIDTRPHQP